MVTHPDFADVEAALADDATARALGSSAPGLLLSADLIVRWSNEAARAYFRAMSEDDLSSRLSRGDEPGWKRLRQLLRLTEPGAPARRELLRFRLLDGFDASFWRVQRLSGPAALLALSLAEGEKAIPLIAAAGLASGDNDAQTHRRPFASSEPRPLGLAAARAPIRSLWRADPDGRVVETDGVFENLVGGERLIGRTIFEAAEAAGADHDGLLSRAIRSGETWSDIRLSWPTRDGQGELQVAFGAAPQRDRTGRLDCWRGYIVIARNSLGGPQLQSVDAPSKPHQSPTVSPAVEPTPATANDDGPRDSGFGPNVVTLRRLQLVRTETERSEDVEGTPPAAPPAAADVKRGDASPAHGGLTSVERSAFQEIALALGARLPGLTRKLQTSDQAADIAIPDRNEPTANDATSHRARADALKVDADSPGAARVLPDAFLAAALRAAPSPVAIHQDAALLWVNDAFLFLTGWSSADLLGGSTRVAEVLRAMTAPSVAKVALPTQSGESVVAKASSSCIDLPTGQAIITTFEVGESVEKVRLDVLEHELRRRDGDARELHAILDTATDGVVVLDDVGRILSLNRAAEALFGLDQSAVVGASFTSLLSPESHNAALDYFGQVSSNSVASVLNDGRELVGRAHRGGPMPIFMTLGRLNAGASIKFCAVLRDMTAWKKVEKELDEARREAERSSALKSDFLAKVSHEIRTPLNAILGFAEVIMDQRFGPVGNERYREYLKDIHASGTHVMSLVNDLLDLSKIEAGKMELDFVGVDVNKIVTECVSIMQPQANSERVIVRLSTAPNMPHVLADERSLRQIVLNLLSNAVKFNEPGGQVIVSTALTDAGHSVIRIRDTGIGMSEADLVTALEPFRQVHSSRKMTGTGLGLPLTKALVEANHASFTLKSKKAEGTLAEVAFPTARVMAH